jgi:glycerophosphoryl diester phosphodiesterase
MIVLSHRGYWTEAREKNTEGAFMLSFDSGYGTETDVRDCLGSLVISHDMPTGDAIPFARFLALHGGRPLPLALNVKADGLATPLCAAVRAADAPDWFVFDMSIPDTRSYFAAEAPVFMRMIEVEQSPPWLDRAAGVWLDAFESDWYSMDLLRRQLDERRVCVVSPELHGRDPRALWDSIGPLADHPGLLLCTDRPAAATDFFGEEA